MQAGSSMQPRPTTRLSGDMALRMRRPPQEYVTLLSQSEQEFRSFVDSFESDPAFRKLVNDGAILRVRLRGKIPRERYEEFMDRQLLEFLRTYEITQREGWEHDFMSSSAVSRVAELAAKYRTPVGELLRHLRYIRSAGQDALTNTTLALHGKTAAGPAAYDDTTASSEMVDLAEVIETTREFVQRYNVSEQDFLDLVLGGDSTSEELAQRLSCSLREAEEVLEAADRVYLAQNYEDAGQLTPVRERAGQSTPVRSDDDLVAFVQIVDDKVSIQFHYDSVYTHRYHIKKDLVQDTAQTANEAGATGPDARELLLRARFINQRLSVLSRLITTLCNQQTEYLLTGDERQLKPWAQAELARQLGEHPSTVSRLIRSKVIDTPWGRTPLLFLCQSKTDVVARLVAQFPDLTDQEVVTRLREDYDCYIARRTVAYHRGKRLRRNKRHKSSQSSKSARVDPSEIAAQK